MKTIQVQYEFKRYLSGYFGLRRELNDPSIIACMQRNVSQDITILSPSISPLLKKTW